MSKIYAITCGEYSDYCIYGITTDSERAKKMRDIVAADNKYDEVYIEEFEDGVFKYERLNSIIPKEYWKVQLFSNGDAAKSWKYTADSAKEKIEVHSYTEYGEWEYRQGCPPRRKIYAVVEVSGIIAEDKEHALKIAYDKAMEYKAKKENIT